MDFHWEILYIYIYISIYTLQNVCIFYVHDMYVYEKINLDKANNNMKLYIL